MRLPRSTVPTTPTKVKYTPAAAAGFSEVESAQVEAMPTSVSANGLPEDRGAVDSPSGPAAGHRQGPEIETPGAPSALVLTLATLAMPSFDL